MNYNKLESLIDTRLTPKVVLGVGPMSKNCVDATAEIANQLQIPIMLIASRRQVECAALGGGYVNKWTTEEFAKYVKEKDTGDFIVLARDHGGPWQGTDEAKLTYEAAYENAEISFAADVENGFDMIHIDPSVKDRPMPEIEADVEGLLIHCENIAKGRDIIYECGSEETNGKITDPQAFFDFVEFCSKGLSNKVKFVVGQTGTLVKETRNVGTFDDDRAAKLVEICNLNGVKLKEHNLDYVDDAVLLKHPKLGIHSANVAPEFGVIETRRLLEALKEHKFKKERKRFLEIALESNKWDKWVISDLTDEEKAVIAGHYVFSEPEVKDIIAKVNEKIYLNDILKNAIQFGILRYLKSFGWIR